MKYYNSGEALAMLEKDPSLEFKNIGEGKFYTLYCDNNKIKIISDKGIDSGFKIGDKWILIQKPVDFMKAINSNRKIKPEKYQGHYVTIEQLMDIFYELDENKVLEYINGKWYIEE